MVHVRSRIPAFNGAGRLRPWDVGNDTLFVAAVDGRSVLVIANFSETRQRYWLPEGTWRDVLGTDSGGALTGEMVVEPLVVHWLLEDVAGA